MELKFRAWHKEHGRYYLVTSLFIDYIGEETAYNLFDDRKAMLEVLHVGQDEVIIEQYTGLKDTNGKEIYVGDIVNCTRGCPHVVEIRMEHGGTYFGGMPTVYLSGLNEGYAWTEDEERIGNIHENKELLD